MTFPRPRAVPLADDDGERRLTAKWQANYCSVMSIRKSIRTRGGGGMTTSSPETQCCGGTRSRSLTFIGRSTGEWKDCPCVSRDHDPALWPGNVSRAAAPASPRSTTVALRARPEKSSRKRWSMPGMTLGDAAGASSPCGCRLIPTPPSMERGRPAPGPCLSIGPGSTAPDAPPSSMTPAE
jgi:hypothetical protein